MDSIAQIVGCILFIIIASVPWIMAEVLYKSGRGLNQKQMERSEQDTTEPQEIGYGQCANAMLKMWMDNVVTDGEYNRIMDRLNKLYFSGDEKKE